MVWLRNGMLSGNGPLGAAPLPPAPAAHRDYDVRTVRLAFPSWNDGTDPYYSDLSMTPRGLPVAVCVTGEMDADSVTEFLMPTGAAAPDRPTLPVARCVRWRPCGRGWRRSPEAL